MKKILFALIVLVFASQIVSAHPISVETGASQSFASHKLIAQAESEEEGTSEKVYIPPEKSISKAIMMSLVLPGTGQIYSQKKYGFAYMAIEAAAWVGYFVYNKKGDDKVAEYEDFADEHYNRDRFYEVKEDLVDRALEHAEQTDKLNIYIETFPVYDDEGNFSHYGIREGNHFTLDETNTQHYYEDLGKYDKYIFGWDDWYTEAYYSILDDGTPDFEQYYEYDSFIWNEWNPINDHVIPDEIGSEQTVDGTRYYYGKQETDNRQKYRDMRHEANDLHSMADVSMGVVLVNHFVSAIDAARVTRNYNKQLAKKREEKPFEIDFGVDWLRKGDPEAKLALIWNY